MRNKGNHNKEANKLQYMIYIIFVAIKYLYVTETFVILAYKITCKE